MIGHFRALMVLPLALLWTLGQAAAGVGHGETVANRACGSCHSVGHDGAAALAPPFAVIEARPRMDRDKLALFLILPHPEMPNVWLTPREADDLADYILRNRPPKLPIELPIISNLPAYDEN